MASTQQLSYREATAWIDSKLGRCPMKAPPHLSRVLHLPRHNAATMHLPVYEIAALYHKAVGNKRLGSSIYTASLFSMQKPREDGTNAQVADLVDFSRDGNGGLEIQVQRRAPLGFQDSDVRL